MSYLEDMVATGDKASVRDALVSILNSDRTLGDGEFIDSLKYVNREMTYFFDEDTDEDFGITKPYDINDWDKVAVSLNHSFTKERIKLLKDISATVYPIEKEVEENINVSSGASYTDNIIDRRDAVYEEQDKGRNDNVKKPMPPLVKIIIVGGGVILLIAGTVLVVNHLDNQKANQRQESSTHHMNH